MKKILLIGGAGFIGNPLVNYLFKLGYKVTIFDNLSYQQSLNLPDGIVLVKDTVENIENYKNLINDHDVIFYMASPRLLHLGKKEQILPHLDYLKKTLNLCKKNISFYFFSSCSVYGYNSKLMTEDSPTEVTSLYSQLKIESEKILSNYPKNFKILRLATLFGYSSLSRNDLLINNFIRDIKETDTIEIFDGQAWRPNIFIDDLVQVLEKIIKSDIKERVINVGHDSLNITKNDLVDIISRILNKSVTKIHFEPQDTRSYRVDFTLLNRYIRHTYITYEKSIKKMI